MCGGPDYCGNYNQQNCVSAPMFNRCRLPCGGKTIQKFYVKESDDNHSRDRAPEDYIGSSSGAAFAYENIGGAYHQHKVTEEHPEGPCQNR
jgi:hypothetical protein